MDYLKELINGLPGNVLANIVASLVTLVLAAVFRRKGLSSQASRKIVQNPDTGQRVFAQNSQVSIVGDGSNNTTHTTNVTNNTYKNYGVQPRTQGKSTSSSDDDMVLYGFAAVVGFGVLLWLTRYLPAITLVPLWAGGVTVAITSITLWTNRLSYTTVAIRKAIFAVFGLIVSSILATLTMLQAQETSNPYSLTSIAVHTNQGAGSDKVITGAIPRFLHLTSLGNQEYMYAFLLGVLAFVLNWLAVVYFLHLALGSLLLPASSDGQGGTVAPGKLGSKINRVLNRLSTSFVESSLLRMIVMIVMTGLMTWLITEPGYTQLTAWFASGMDWLQGFIRQL